MNKIVSSFLIVTACMMQQSGCLAGETNHDAMHEFHDNDIKAYHAKLYDFIDSNASMRSFVQQYMPPKSMLKQVIADENAMNKRSICKYNNEQKDFMIKDNDILRPILASRMKNYIVQKGYQSVDVPDKKIVLVDDNLRVIVRKVDYNIINSHTTITLEQIKELIDVIKETGYVDFIKEYQTNQNLVIDKQNGKFVFIDTDPRSFLKKNEMISEALYNLDTMLKKWKAVLSDDAKKYLSNAISETKCKPMGTDIFDRNDLDSCPIVYKDIENFRREYPTGATRFFY